MIEIDLNVLANSPAGNICAPCGRQSVRYWHGGSMWICELCDLPMGETIGPVELEVWRGLLMAKAGERAIKACSDHKIAVWFLERYRRLGLT